MDAATGQALRQRRLRLRLTLDEVAEATAIPGDYLEALEAGRVHQLPPGPYAEAYVRTYEKCLERVELAGPDAGPPSLGSEPGAFTRFDTVPTPEGGDAPPTDPVVVTRPVPETAPPRRWVPVQAVRAVAVVSTVTFFVIVGWQGVSELHRLQARPHVAVRPPIEVNVRLLRNARLEVRVDGQTQASRVFAGGETLHFEGDDRIEVDVPTLDAVRLSFDGHDVSPRGHQDRPRTLVFVNDGATR